MYKARDGSEIYVLRPEKPGRTKQEYKIFNLQIFLKKPGKKEFRPNHLRLLIDLYLKKISDPEKSEYIFSVIERIFNGEDPKNFINDVKNMRFKMQIDDVDINLYCAQLFMLEQDICYEKSKYDPHRLFLMGYIRYVRSGEEEIDKIARGIAVGYPPPPRFTK